MAVALALPTRMVATGSVDGAPLMLGVGSSLMTAPADDALDVTVPASVTTDELASPTVVLRVCVFRTLVMRSCTVVPWGSWPMIGFSACWRGSVTAPSCERTVLLLRSTVAIEPKPVAVGAALAIDAVVAEQTRPIPRIELTWGGRLGVPHALALVSVGVAALAFDSCWTVATGVTCPAPVASANGSDVTLAAEVPRVSALPATERFN